MRTFLRLLILSCLPAALFALPPTMPADSYQRCMSELKTAIKNNDSATIKRNAENLKTYGLQADGERIIKEAQARNKNMFEQVKESYDQFYELQEAAGKKSVKACGQLIDAIQKKLTDQAMEELLPGGLTKDVVLMLRDMYKCKEEAAALRKTALTIRDSNRIWNACDEMIKTFGPILEELKQERKMLGEVENTYKNAAAAVRTHEAPKNEKPKPETKKENPEQTPESEAPEQAFVETPSLPEQNSGTSAGSGEKTTVKGYVADSKGKTTLTETTDKNGNVIKTVYTTTDLNGKVIKVETYGPEGSVIHEQSPATASAANEALKNTSREAARNSSRTPTGRGHGGKGGGGGGARRGRCTCP